MSFRLVVTNMRTIFVYQLKQRQMITTQKENKMRKTLNAAIAWANSLHLNPYHVGGDYALFSGDLQLYYDYSVGSWVVASEKRVRWGLYGYRNVNILHTMPL